MELLNQFAHAIESIPPEIWGLIGVSAIASAFQQKVNQWFSVQSDKVKTFITGVISLVVVAIPALIGFLQTNPQLFGAYTATVFTAMTFLYRFLIKPLTNQLNQFKAWKTSQDTVETPAPVVTDTVVPPVPVVSASTAPLAPKEFQG